MKYEISYYPIVLLCHAMPCNLTIWRSVPLSYGRYIYHTQHIWTSKINYKRIYFPILCFLAVKLNKQIFSCKEKLEMNFIFCNLMLLQSPIIDNTQVWVPCKLQLINVEMRQWSCWRLLSQVRWNDPIFIFILWYMNIYYIIYKYIISPCNLSNKIKTKMCRLREEEAQKI